MPTERNKKTTGKKKSISRKGGPKNTFAPDRPFAEGVRGAESFIIQEGIEYPRQGLFPKGLIDG